MDLKVLLDKLAIYYKKDELVNIVKGFNSIRPVTLRINNIKSSGEEVISDLEKNNISYDRVPWYSKALILKDANEQMISKLAIYNEGKIYLQSLSSMLPPLFLQPKEDELILDMAAAPGGKTTEMAALTNNKAMITAIEKNKVRAERLKYNLNLQGAKKVVVLNCDARYLDDYFMFDKILLDAPCSGSGTIEDGQLNKNLTEDLIKRSIDRQKQLLEIAIKHLKVKGTLIYSTCSILKCENEEVLKYILDKYDNIKLDVLKLDNFENIKKLKSDLDGVLTICPTDLYEGFFIAKLIKVS